MEDLIKMVIGKTKSIKTITHVCFFVLFLLAIGACGPSWTVIRESGPPSALKQVAILNVVFDYSGTLVEDMPVNEWIKKKTVEEPDYKARYLKMMSTFEEKFIEGFYNKAGYRYALRRFQPGTRPGKRTAVVHVHINSLEIGAYIPFANPPTEISVNVLWHISGVVVDEINLIEESTHSIIEPSVHQHIQKLGLIIGSETAEFFLDKHDD